MSGEDFHTQLRRIWEQLGSSSRSPGDTQRQQVAITSSVDKQHNSAKSNEHIIQHQVAVLPQASIRTDEPKHRLSNTVAARYVKNLILANRYLDAGEFVASTQVSSFSLTKEFNGWPSANTLIADLKSNDKPILAELEQSHHIKVMGESRPRTQQEARGIEERATEAAHAPIPAPVPKEDSAALVQLDKVLNQNDLWLGYSPIKGWVLFDRKHPEYKKYGNRPFVLLHDGSIDRLSQEEFSKGPQGPWALCFWRNHLDSTTKQFAGSAAVLLPKVLHYVQEAELSAQQRVKSAVDQDEILTTRHLNIAADREFQKKRVAERRAHFSADLPDRVRTLSDLAKQILVGATGPEPAWSLGIAAAEHLHENGIDHLWHLTDARNLESIRCKSGLLSWAGISALGIADAHPLANDRSRAYDVQLDREQYVRLSFIPNSWFFHRVRGLRQLVWLRFSLKVLTLGDVFYSLGNAASGSVALQDKLPSIGINWELVKPFSGPHTNERGPTKYERQYSNNVEDPLLFERTKKALNSEILIKYFLPLEFCNGVFDCRNGERIQF